MSDGGGVRTLGNGVDVAVDVVHPTKNTIANAIPMSFGEDFTMLVLAPFVVKHQSRPTICVTCAGAGGWPRIASMFCLGLRLGNGLIIPQFARRLIWAGNAAAHSQSWPGDDVGKGRRWGERGRETRQA